MNQVERLVICLKDYGAKCDDNGGKELGFSDWGK